MLLRIHWSPSQTMTPIGNWKLENGNLGSDDRATCHPEGAVRPRDLLFSSTATKGSLLASPACASRLGMTVDRLFRSLCALWLCGIFFPGFVAPTPAQSIDKPSVTIDEDVTAFAFAPDGRIVYAVRRVYKNKKYDMQRDDI